MSKYLLALAFMLSTPSFAAPAETCQAIFKVRYLIDETHNSDGTITEHMGKVEIPGASCTVLLGSECTTESEVDSCMCHSRGTSDEPISFSALIIHEGGSVRFQGWGKAQVYDDSSVSGTGPQFDLGYFNGEGSTSIGTGASFTVYQSVPARFLLKGDRFSHVQIPAGPQGPHYEDLRNTFAYEYGLRCSYSP